MSLALAFVSLYADNLAVRSRVSLSLAASNA